MPSARVLILYNEPVLPVGHSDFESEHDVLDAVELVSRALDGAGFDARQLGINTDVRHLLDFLADWRPDAVFNLFEGTAVHGATEAYVAGLLEWHGVPFTGSPATALCLGRGKHLAKYLFRGAGLPTPAFVAVNGSDVPRCPLTWPVIVKPALEDASVGVDHGSVIADQEQLEARVARLVHDYGPPVLVEEYIAGRELNVAVIQTPALCTLPISEIVFTNEGPGRWPIVTYDAKWRRGSADYEGTPVRCPADVSPRLAKYLTDVAIRAFRLLDCRDYARVDFRVRPDDSAYLLEVNPNPDFGPDGGLARGLELAGIGHGQFAVALVRQALARGGRLARSELPADRLS
jgi:D-alanine-D-alanine ligase